MARKYAKRTKSTARKTYADYLFERQKLEQKGYILKQAMDEENFNNQYERMIKGKKAGEIKSQPFQELMRRERKMSAKRARIFQKAYEEYYSQDQFKDTKYIKKKITLKEAQKLPTKEITALGAFINKTKSTGLYGGDYE